MNQDLHDKAAPLVGGPHQGRTMLLAELDPGTCFVPVLPRPAQIEIPPPFPYNGMKG
jgi:hypothetical protein